MSVATRIIDRQLIVPSVQLGVGIAIDIVGFWDQSAVRTDDISSRDLSRNDIQDDANVLAISHTRSVDHLHPFHLLWLQRLHIGSRSHHIVDPHLNGTDKRICSRDGFADVIDLYIWQWQHLQKTVTRSCRLGHCLRRVDHLTVDAADYPRTSHHYLFELHAVVWYLVLCLQSRH